MKCPRCQTTNPKYFGELNGRFYCRRCIEFDLIFVDQLLETEHITYPYSNVYYQLDYDLSSKQKNISESLVNNYTEGKNAVVLAVCGAGKTEIVYDVMKLVLNQGKRVCFAVPRKSLVEELSIRIQKQFINIVPEVFYGEKKGDIHGQLIICTTHQLYRFYQQFDLLILDETDAFPYYHNSLLKDMLFQSLKGQYIFMSATLDIGEYEDASYFVLNRRYHKFDLPVPTIKILPKFLWLVFIKNKLKLWDHPVIIYVPRIKDFEIFTRYFKGYKFRCVSSKTKNISNVIELLRNQEIDFIVSTTILERGITVIDVYVIVYNAASNIFNMSTLIQIAGRVGRNPMYPKGEVIFLSSFKTKEMKLCISKIVSLNKIDA